MSELNHDVLDVRVEHAGALIPFNVVQKITSIDSQVVNFLPANPGTYTVTVTCLDKHITGQSTASRFRRFPFSLYNFFTLHLAINS